MKIETHTDDVRISSKYVTSLRTMGQKYWDEYKIILRKGDFVQPPASSDCDESLGDDSFRIKHVTVGSDFISYWIERVPYDYENGKEGE